MTYNIPTIIYGVVGLLVFLNIGGMSVAHAQYIYYEKTTNERVYKIVSIKFFYFSFNLN